jgi:hypothetical protein
MKLTTKLAMSVATLALSAPVPALAAPAIGSHGAAPHTKTQHTATPGPKAGLPAEAKAYGRYCQSESKQHAAGEKGTPFSRCVRAMAKLAQSKSHDAKAACATESKKHVDGEKATAFSRCVSGAAKLSHDQKTK